MRVDFNWNGANPPWVSWVALKVIGLDEGGIQANDYGYYTGN